MTMACSGSVHCPIYFTLMSVSEHEGNLHFKKFSLIFAVAVGIIYGTLNAMIVT